MGMDREKQLVFGIGAGTDGVPVLFLGLTRPAFEYASGELCHELDLTKINLPIKMVIFARETYDDARKHIDEIFAAAGVPVFDETRRDFGIKK